MKLAYVVCVMNGEIATNVTGYRIPSWLMSSLKSFFRSTPHVAPLQFGDERFQDIPRWSEYPAFTVDVASCQLPSGAAWLLSCLLELRVPIWNPWNADTRHEWTSIGGFRYRYRCAGNPWSRLAAGLVSGRKFHFREQPVPRFTHSWPGQTPPCSRTVLIVRDPRDALYSAWRRVEASRGLDGDSPNRFVTYANGIRPGQDYREVDYWDRYHAAWIAYSSGRPFLMIRFEDFKREPVHVLTNVCEFLGLSANISEITKAAALSDYQRVSRIDDDMVRSGIFEWKLNRAGMPNEFMTTYTPEMKSVFSKAGTATWQHLGYDPSA